MRILHPCPSEPPSPLLWPVSLVSAFHEAGAERGSGGSSMAEQPAAPSLWLPRVSNNLSAVPLFPGQFPPATSDFQLPDRNTNIGISLEWSGESHSVVFDDPVRLRPCKVNKWLFISSPALSLCQFLYHVSFRWEKHSFWHCVLSINDLRVQDWKMWSHSGSSISIPSSLQIYFWGVGPKSHTRWYIVPILEGDNEDRELVVCCGSHRPVEQVGDEQNLGLSWSSHSWIIAL